MANESRVPVFAQLDIPFPSPAEAEIAYNSLRVDKEPSRSSTTKQLSVNSNILNVKISSSDTRQLRVALNSFMEHVLLVSDTILRFKQ